MKKVVLSLGSNLLKRDFFLLKATELINCKVGKIIEKSSITETESWGFDSSPFLNQVLIVETNHTPEEVLEITQGIERELGRAEKSGHDEQGNPIYHDRTIDIDILLFEDEIRNSSALTIPHPLLTQRLFILKLLIELFEDQVVPPYTKTFKQLANSITQRGNEI